MHVNKYHLLLQVDVDRSVEYIYLGGYITGIGDQRIGHV